MFFILKIEPLFDYEAMKNRIDEYFNNVTPEQLKKDVEDAGYEVYKNTPNFLPTHPKQNI